jgi:CBS domain-containing protein
MEAKDLMISASDCARVAEDETVYDAVVMLEAWRQRSRSEYRPRVILVHDEDFRTIGGLRQVDMLRALSAGRVVSPGTSPALAGPVEATAPPSSPDASAGPRDILKDLSEAAHRVRVRDAMHHYHEEEYIDAHTSLEEVLDRLLSGPYLNLVVTSANTTIGIVRLSDVFEAVCNKIERSNLK